MALDDRLAAELAALARSGLERAPPKVQRTGPVTYRLDGHEVVGLCSNDYLGLAADPRLHPPHEAPVGAGASRLINGDWPELRAAEVALASLADTDDAVLFPSGFQANVGVLPSLIRSGDIVHSDRLAHASLIDGLRLAPVRPHILPHLAAPPTPAATDPMVVWILESIFSMDGDRAPLDAARDFVASGGTLYLDEAHAIGLFPGGRPWSTHHGLRPAVLLGTLGKALGCAGAFIGGSRTLCTWIRTRARSFVFSTGFSPALAVRVTRAVDLVGGAPGDLLREQLWANATHLGRLLGDPTPAPSPIFPVLVGDNDVAVSVAADLLRRGYHVQPIRPPTVPDGTARLRITVSAAHRTEHLDAFVEALHAALRPHGVEPRVDRGRTQPLTDTPSTGTDPR